jgi:hypothetical protein
VSCYAKHPELPGIECWRGPGHDGHHGKECYSWPNPESPAYREAYEQGRWDMRELAAEWAEGPVCPHPCDCDACNALRDAAKAIRDIPVK